MYLDNALINACHEQGINVSKVAGDLLTAYLAKVLKIKAEPNGPGKIVQESIIDVVVQAQREAEELERRRQLWDKLAVPVATARYYEKHEWKGHPRQRSKWLKDQSAALGISVEELEKWVRGDYDTEAH